MTTHSFVWLSTGGGAWSLGSNWDDVTDGLDPSLVAPGAQDSVTVTGPSGAQMQTITGGGLAGAAMFAGNTLLSGSYAFGTLSVGGTGGGGLLQLGAGASLAADAADIASGSLLAGRGSTLSVAGTVSLGTDGVAGATLNATGGSTAVVMALRLLDSADSIYVDPTSILEVGAAGGAAAGTLTIDAGASLSGQGSANAYGAVANDGTLAAVGGTLTVGRLGGTGTLQIDAGATLTLNGACGAGQTVAFEGAGATLALRQEAFAPTGTLTGFVAGAAIDVVGSQISSASFAATGISGGTLTLLYGGQVAATFLLAGNYAGSVFLTAGDGAGGTLVTVTPSAGGGGGPSPGTSTPDQYAWTAPGSGAWNQAANWQDLTTGATPATIAPGARNLVTVTASQTAFSVITGPANAAALTLLGEVGLQGKYTLGSLTVGQASGVTFAPGTLDVLAGSTVTAGNASIADGGIDVSGSAAALTVGGTLVLGGSAQLGVGLPTASLTVSAGGTVRAAGLVLGGGSGASLTTDPNGLVEIGGQGGGVAGAITVDAGATLAGNGRVNPFGSIVDNGTVLATGGTLTLGAVTGTGTLAVAPGATLELLSATAAPIVLDGSAAAGVSVLALSNAFAAPTGLVSGLTVGDAIDLEGSTLTSAQYNPPATGNYILLIYGSTVVARIAVAGTLTGEHVVLTSDGAGGSLVTLVANSGGGGGGAGQTGTDQLAWTNPVGGGWSRAANWTDVTTGTVARLPPGPQTSVQLVGPTGGLFQSITGTGTCASLTATGDSFLSGIFTTTQLVVGQAGSGMSAAVDGVLGVGAASTLTVSQATLASGELLCESTGALIGITGTLTLGKGQAGVGQSDALLSAGGHGIVHLGGLALAGGDSVVVSVDATAIVEVGTAGGAVQGAFTVDAGALASGSGTLNAYGPVVDNGEIDAQGGTLLVGATSGTGTLGIGTEATLVLGGADSCPIAFLGGGATLVLPGLAQLPTGAIAGFSPGDSIVAGSPVDSVAFQQGVGFGTLTLSVGGQVAGQLLLAGNFAGETFAVQPDGSGAAIVLTQGPVGPPPGTVTPDSYRWTGAAGSGAWSSAGNWVDVTLGTGPAAVAPGQNDRVSITAGSAPWTLTGPADAASLSLAGTVSLAGTYAIGTLSVGAGQTPGLLALAAGADISAADAQVAGAIAVGGGVFAVGGTLALATGGVLAVSGGSAVRLGAATLEAGSVLAADPTASIEIGGTIGAAAGSVTIDATGLLQGAGTVELAGTIADQGTIVASGGTLVLGAVSGTGTLLVGAAADLVLTGAVAPGLIADFTGGGTLTLAAAQGRPAIADFGTGDAILLPVSGATRADYAITGPGTGLLTLSNGSQVLDQLTLLGSQAGRIFSVAASPGGGTILTTGPDPNAGQEGGPPMTTTFSTGQITRGDLLTELAAAFPYVSQGDAGTLIGNQGIYLDYSTDGLAPAQTVFGGAGQIPGVNVEIVAPLDGVTSGSVGPGGVIAMAAGYSAVLLQGAENLGLTDGRLGHALLVGNFGADTIAALGDGDTLVGATGANTVFFASIHGGNGSASLPIDVYVHGGGNDLIATNYDNAAITTSGGQSTVSLGASLNDVVSYGSDRIVCGGIGGNDTVTSLAPAGRAGDVVFSPNQGILTFVGGNAPSTVVGGGGTVEFQGGAGSGSLLWAGSSDVNYTGGAGAALIVAGSGFASVTGGSGPITVFGGTGPGVFSGAPGSDFVVGNGDTTVRATAGNGIWLEGAAPVSVAGAAGVDVYGGQSIGNNIFQAFAGNETLWGGAGNDQFLAGTGNDIFVSGGGRDVFSFTNGVAMGTDTIVGFVAGESTIALHGFGAQVPHLAIAYGDTVINLQGGAQIIIENATNLTAANFTLS